MKAKQRHTTNEQHLILKFTSYTEIQSSTGLPPPLFLAAGLGKVTVATNSKVTNQCCNPHKLLDLISLQLSNKAPHESKQYVGFFLSS